MKISFSWLRNYLKTDIPADQIASILTDIGLEVESIEKKEAIKGGLAGVVVGEVLTCERHPDADRLSVTTVNLGEGEPVQIVCGAPNVAAGQKVVVATVNCTLYPAGEEEGFKIKRSKIRGVESLGMICAEDELGLGSSHEGIMVLEADAAPGTPASSYFGLEEDYIFEIGLTPNRIDAASHYGVARDLAAYMAYNNIPHQFGLPPVDNFKQGDGSREIKVEVENSEAAPRYMGVTMTGIKVGPSPAWLQDKLRMIGMMPRNNVVDITNYVLHEVGQPLHAFDADKVGGGKIIVKCCPEGTPFTTLEGTERKLSSSDLMICDAGKPMCIAGVLGGLDSGITENTTAIFLESACFNPVWIRKTAKRHGINTDASFRFERGTDPNIPPYALMRAATMIEELTGGKVTSKVTDIYPVPADPFRFDISVTRTESLIGKKIGGEVIKRIIESLEIKIEKEQGDILSVAVPPYRVDVQREADLIEDILRIYGYNNVEIPTALNSTVTYAPDPDKDKIRNTISDMLTSCGFNEIMSNSLTKAEYYRNLTSYPAERCVKILNPLSGDLNVMRQTLLFNALEAAQLNINRRNQNLKLYELGNCYSYIKSKEQEGGLAPYLERARLSVLITGLDHSPSWNIKAAPTSFYTLKAAMEKILLRLGTDPDSARMETLESDLYDEAAAVSVQGKRVFDIGVVSSKICSAFDIKAKVYYMEGDFEALVRIASRQKIAVSELSKFPEVKRDLALLIHSDVTFSELRSIAFATEKKLLKNVTLFDVYEGEKLPEGTKSYALGFTLEDNTGTLTDAVIDKTMNNLIREFEAKAGAAIR